MLYLQLNEDTNNVAISENEVIFVQLFAYLMCTELKFGVY